MTTRMEEAEEWISDKEDNIMKNNKAEKKRERMIMEHKSRLSQLSHSIKHNNICVIGVSEEKER